MSEETLLEFPCQFAIKVMGKNSSDFSEIVVGIIQSYVIGREVIVKSRPSKGNNYVAITVTIEATSKKQLDAIYQELTDCPDVLMSL